MPKDNALKRFGKNIRDRREALGLSQEALAEKADLDRTYIGGVERGERNATLQDHAAPGEGRPARPETRTGKSLCFRRPDLAALTRKAFFVSHMSPPDKQSTTDAINQKLDEIIAERRRQRAPAPTLREAPAAGNRLWLYILCLPAAIGACAAGYLIYTAATDKPAAPATIASDLTHWNPTPEATPTHSSVAPPPPAPVAAKTPSIIYQDQPVRYQSSAQSERRAPQAPPRITSGQTRAVIVDSAPATPPPSAAPADASGAHAKVAKEHAYQHFRYKYKVGSANYTVTSLNIVTDETVEVPGWNRHRTTGEAGIEYYDNASGKRTTRRFEVLTEHKNGRIVPVDITVK